MSIQKLETQQVDELAQGASKEYVLENIAQAVTTHDTSTTSHNDIREALDDEEEARTTTDASLQVQIDALASRSDVVDVVGTYAELLAYDTSKLRENDVIKVLQDSTHNNAISYYRWANSVWNYIGSQGPYYTTTETDALLAEKADSDDVYTKTEADTLLAAKANQSTTYTKTETDNMLALKANAVNVYTKTETDSRLDGKQNLLTAGGGINITNSTISCTVDSIPWGNLTGTLSDQSDLQTALSAKADASTSYTKTEVDTALAGKQATLAAGTGITITDNTIATTAILAPVQSTGTSTTDVMSQKAVTDAIGTKANASEVYNKTSVDTMIAAKQDTLVAGSNITISGTTISSTATITPVQSTGSSTTDVMSQNAVTTELNQKASQASLTAVEAEIPTKTSELTNDSTFQTQAQVAASIAAAVPDVIDNLTSTSSADALSAKQGKELSDRITNIGARGRYLSTWNCTTGLPTTNPSTSLPYTYATGDYYIVSTIAGSGSYNYKPIGTSYDGTASRTVETNTVAANDTYLFDGTSWTLIHTELPVITVDSALSSTSQNPVENRVVKAAVDAKADSSSLAAVATSGAYSDISGTPTLATVATSGSYNDLSNTPTVAQFTYTTTDPGAGGTLAANNFIVVYQA